MHNTMQRFAAEQHRAWARMAQKRGCPLPSVLRQGGAAVQKHLEDCPHCREELERLPLYEALAEHLPPAEAILEDTLFAPGQVRALRAAAAHPTEEDSEFFTPPTLLVLSVDDTIQGLVRVAQLHDEPALQAVGDVPLPPPCQGRFVESWNTYPIFSEYMGPVLVQVSEEVVAHVREQSKAGLPEVPPNSPVEAFRSLEMDVGAYFSRISVIRSMELLEQRQGDRMKSAAPSKIIAFPQKAFSKGTGEQPVMVAVLGMKEKKRSRAVWKTMAMAACLCIMVGTFWLNRPALKHEHGVSAPVLASLQAFIDQGGGDTVRGAAAAAPLAWEVTGARQDIPASWKAFAAGQWAARAKVAPSPEVFPLVWSASTGKGAASWEAHPYYDLGVLAFATDMACKHDVRPAPAMASALTQTARTLSDRIQKSDGPEAAFVQALQQSPLSCQALQVHLDALDDALRRP